MRDRKGNHRPAFKAQVAIDSLREDGATEELARKHNLDPELIMRWQQRLLKNAAMLFRARNLPSIKRTAAGMEMPSLRGSFKSAHMTSDSDVRGELAEALRIWRRKGPEVALALLEQLATRTSNAEVHLQAGIAARLLRRLDCSRQHLRAALGMDHRNANVLVQLSLLETDQKRAFEIIQNALTIDSRLPDAYIHGANYLKELGQLDRACDFLQHGLQATGGHANLWLELGRLYRTSGDRHLAFRCFDQAIERNPALFDAYRDYAFELNSVMLATHPSNVHEKRVVETPIQLLERWLATENLSLAEIANLLRHKGIRRYVVSPGGGGVGDRLLSANIAARLCEFLGLEFGGIDRDTFQLGIERSEWCTKPGSAGGFYTQLGFAGLPQIERSQCLYYDRRNVSPENWLLGLRNRIATSRVRFDYLCTSIPGKLFRQLSPFLCDSNGNYVDNDFFRALSKTTQEPCKSYQADVLFHLRLGDVANISDIVPNAVLIPWRFVYFGEIYKNDDRNWINRSMRYDKVHEFSEAVCRIRQALPCARIGVITDGYDYSYEYLRSDESVQRLKDLGVSIEEMDLDTRKKNQQEAFISRFHQADFLIYGESAESFSQTLDALVSSRFIVSSSGIFASAIVNNFSTLPQTVLLFHRDREHPARRGVVFEYVTVDNFSEKLIALLSSE